MKNKTCGKCGQKFTNSYFYFSSFNEEGSSFCRKCTCTAIQKNTYTLAALLKELDVPWYAQLWRQIIRRCPTGSYTPTEQQNRIAAYITEANLQYKNQHYKDGEYCSPIYNPFK